MTGWWWWLVVALGAPLTADEAVGLALARSVEVAAARGAVERARGVAQATASLREEPVLQGQASFVGEVYGVALTQRVSLSGEGVADHRRAMAALAAASASERRTGFEVAAAARVAWVRAVEAEQAVGLAAQALDLAARLRAAAEARLEFGEGSALEVRLARLQEVEARAAWTGAVVEEGRRRADLVAWIGGELDALELPADPADGMALVSLDAADRADVAAARDGVDAAVAGLTRERAGTLPPVQLGAFYELEDGDQRGGLTLGVTLPVWGRNADGRAAARAAVDVAQVELAARERAASAEQAATARVLRRLAAPGEGADVMEEARLALDAVAEGYRRGELDLVAASWMRQQVLDGQLAWLAERRWLAEARVAAALARDDVALLGAPP